MNRKTAVVIAAFAIAGPLALTGCNAKGADYGGCSTTNGMSVANKKVLATVSLECVNAPERHSMTIKLQFRDKKHPGWVTVHDLTDNQRHAHHVYSLSNVCIPGEWRLYVSATAIFKGKPSHAEGPSPILDTTKRC